MAELLEKLLVANKKIFSFEGDVRYSISSCNWMVWLIFKHLTKLSCLVHNNFSGFLEWGGGLEVFEEGWSGGE